METKQVAASQDVASEVPSASAKTSKSGKKTVDVSKSLVLAETLNTFLAPLDVPKQTVVREEIAEITKAQIAIVQSVVAIGRSLSRIHHALGQADFDKFCSSVASKMGIPRSTAYRYYGAFNLTTAKFGQATQTILALTDGGKGIVSTTDGKVKLSPGVETTLRKMPALPVNANPTSTEQWARTFVDTYRKESREGTKRNTPLDVVEGMIERFWALATSDGEGTPKGILPRINEMKGATERRAALDSLRAVIEKISQEHSKVAKTINAVGAVVATPAAPAASAPVKGKSKKSAAA